MCVCVYAGWGGGCMVMFSFTMCLKLGMLSFKWGDCLNIVCENMFFGIGRFLKDLCRSKANRQKIYLCNGQVNFPEEKSS